MDVLSDRPHNRSREESLRMAAESENQEPKGATMSPATANPNQALWEKGDFGQIAAFMRQSGEVIVESLKIKPPFALSTWAAERGPRPFRSSRQGPTSPESTSPVILLKPQSGEPRKQASRM